MTHQQQGPSECFLAVCAMLANVSLDEVRAVALHAAGVNRWKKAVNTPRWLTGASAVVHTWPRLDEFFRRLQEGQFVIRRRDPHLNASMLPMCPDGLVAFLTRRCLGKFHIALIHSQMVYDPALSVPHPWEEWWQTEGPDVWEWAFVQINEDLL